MKQGYTHISFVLDNSGSMRHLTNDTIGGYNSFVAKQKEDPGKMTFSLYQFNPEGRHRGYGLRSPVFVQPAMQPPLGPFGPAIANGGFVGISTTGGTAAAPLPSVSVGVAIGGPSEPWAPGALGYDPRASVSINAAPGILMNGIPESPTVSKPATVSTTYEFADLKTIPELSTTTYICDCNTPLLDAIGHAIDETGKILAAMPEDERPEKIIFVILTDGEENASYVYNHPQVTGKIQVQQDQFNWDFIFLGANQDAIQAGHSYGITRGRSMSLSATAQSMGSSYNAVSETVSMMKSAINTKDVNFDETIRSAVMDGTYAGKK